MKNSKYALFEKYGYAIFSLFEKKDIDNFKKKICATLNYKKILQKKLNIKNLGYYHKKILNNEDHIKIVEASKRSVLLNRSACKKIKDNLFIKNLTKISWNNDKFDIKHLMKNKVKNNHAVFRLARPNKISTSDVGGYHIDLHYNNKIYKNMNRLFTIWVPIVGFDKKYTLKISPESHKSLHPTAKFEKQNKYISKIFKKDYAKKFKFIRPNLKIGEVIIFHPNLLHGASINYGQKTRVSMDLRIYNKKIL